MQKTCHTMKYFINYKDEFSTRILLALVIFLVICTKTLSSADYVSVGSSQYPHVAPSPSVISHGRSGGVVQEKECCVARLCEYKILENFSCKVSEYVVSAHAITNAADSQPVTEVNQPGFVSK